MPATTKLPDITASPTSLAIGSASPVSSDSSTSRLSSSTISPSTTIWSPGPSSMMSSSTTSLGNRSRVPDCLRTNGFACPTIASLSSVCLARISCTMPMTLLAMMSSPNSPLITEPVSQHDRQQHAQNRVDPGEDVGPNNVRDAARRRVAGRRWSCHRLPAAPLRHRSGRQRSSGERPQLVRVVVLQIQRVAGETWPWKSFRAAHFRSPTGT